MFELLLKLHAFVLFKSSCFLLLFAAPHLNINLTQ
jgi:hypothetical protein